MHHTGLQAKTSMWRGMSNTLSYSSLHGWFPLCTNSLRRESVKSTDSGSVTGVKSVRPTWFQDTTATRGPPPSSGQGSPEPMHGLRLMIKEEALIISDQPSFPPVCRTGQTGFTLPRNMAMQPTTYQPENLNWRTNARWYNWTKWWWAPRRVAYASWMAPAHWWSCKTTMYPPRHYTARTRWSA